jgi:hypothetical protein
MKVMVDVGCDAMDDERRGRGRGLGCWMLERKSSDRGPRRVARKMP